MVSDSEYGMLSLVLGAGDISENRSVEKTGFYRREWTSLDKALYRSLTRCVEKIVLGSRNAEAPSDTKSMVTSCPRNPGLNSGLNLQAPGRVRVNRGPVTN